MSFHSDSVGRQSIVIRAESSRAPSVCVRFDGLTRFRQQRETHRRRWWRRWCFWLSHFYQIKSIYGELYVLIEWIRLWSSVIYVTLHWMFPCDADDDDDGSSWNVSVEKSARVLHFDSFWQSINESMSRKHAECRQPKPFINIQTPDVTYLYLLHAL